MRISTDLANTIHDRRIELGLSQVQLAEQMRTNQRQISEIETGVSRRPKIDVLVKLSDALEIDLSKLLMQAGFAESDSAAAEFAQRIREQIASKPDPRLAEFMQDWAKLNEPNRKLIAEFAAGLRKSYDDTKEILARQSLFDGKSDKTQ